MVWAITRVLVRHWNAVPSYAILSAGRIATNKEPVYIGENSDMRGRHWNGWLDDVYIYRRALSQDEIRAVMSQSNLGTGDRRQQ
jgi:hypothetical protein